MFLQQTPEQFLQDYWQRRPLLIRKAFPRLESPLDGDDLAGLACEDFVESRLITGSVGQPWTLEHGPLPEQRFGTLPARDWTLLVQDVEKHIPEVAQLLKPFSFLPQWRIDDVMVSYSAPGGSVGPHTDQYDVFLLQGAGTRRWQWSETFAPELADNCDLKMLAQFSAEQEAILHPGDMLYLPPGIAHYGVALEPGLTFSIGLRSPEPRQLMLELGQAIAQRPAQNKPHCDAGRKPSLNPTLLGSRDREAFRTMMRQGLKFSDSELDALLGSFLTRPKDNLQPEVTKAPSSEEFQSRWVQGDRLTPSPTTRFAHYEQHEIVQLFADGVTHRLTLDTFRWLEPFLGAPGTCLNESTPRRSGSVDAPTATQQALAQQLLAAGSLQWTSESLQNDFSND